MSKQSSSSSDADHIGLKHHFLVAMPGVLEGFFDDTVVYLCEHNDRGAMGLVVNKPSEVDAREVFNQLNITPEPGYHPQPLFVGGPVEQERGFILHSMPKKDWSSTVHITGNVYLTASRDILQAIAEGEGPRDALILLGYAGWGAGQLEEEIAQNAWLTVPADDEILFRTPVAEKARSAAALLGVDLRTLSSNAGHA